MPTSVHGLAALAVVLMLPGLLVVRAPWTAVPALSLSFWAVSAGWLPGAGRGRAVAAVLLVSFLLAVLRLLPKHEVPPPTGRTTPAAPAPPPRPGLDPPPLARPECLAVAAIAVLLLALSAPFDHAPGPRLAFQTTVARLLLWRDGVPATAEPLLPLAPVGAHSPALATVAADVSALSGVDPAVTVLLVLLASAGLVLVGLFAVLATRLPPPAAAAAALVGLALAPWPGTLLPFGEGEALLALALGLPAAALVTGHRSRSSAVAAALLLAGSALAQPLVAAGTLGVSGAIAARTLPGEARPRVLLCGSLALLLALPGLLPLARALSWREAAAVASSPGIEELATSAAGLLAIGLAPPVLVRLTRRGGAWWRRPGVLGLVAGVVLAARVHAWVAAGRLPGPALAALRRVAAEAPPLAVVCADGPARHWVPALAGRAAGDPGPWTPPAYAEEWSRRPPRPCEVRLEAEGP